MESGRARAREAENLIESIVSSFCKGNNYKQIERVLSGAAWERTRAKDTLVSVGQTLGGPARVT